MSVPVITEIRILLIEDDDALRTAIERGLRLEGYAVTPADDGREALRLLEEHGCAYDVVICDYSMPGLTGGETVNGIRRRCPEQIVVYVSGFSSFPEDLKAHEAFLQKPVELDVLVAEIRRLTQERVTLPPGEP